MNLEESIARITAALRKMGAEDRSKVLLEAERLSLCEKQKPLPYGPETPDPRG